MADALSIQAALAAVMEDVRAVRKGDRNQQQGYQFRGIDAVMNAVGPALRKHGVIVMPILEDASYRDVQTSQGKSSREVTVRVRYRFTGPAGDHLEAVVPGEAMDWGDKGTAKAMSVAMRTALLQALCLPTDEPDPDSSSYERQAPPAQTAQTAVDVELIREEVLTAGVTYERLQQLWREAKPAHREAVYDKDGNQTTLRKLIEDRAAAMNGAPG